MSDSMTLQELGALVKHIRLTNCPIDYSRGVPCIKYIDPHIDNRDGKCFSIEFRGFGTSVVFHTMNEQRSNPISLFNRCLTYSNTGTIT